MHQQNIESHIRKESLVSGLSNIFFNGLIAWLLLRSGPNLAMFGEHGFAVDIAATAFILPFIVTLIVLPLTGRKLRSGQMHSLPADSSRKLHRLLGNFPAKLWQRACCFGALSLIIASPITLALLWTIGLIEFTPLAYAVFKGVWAGLIAGLLTRPMLLLVLLEYKK